MKQETPAKKLLVHLDLFQFYSIHTYEPSSGYILNHTFFLLLLLIERAAASIKVTLSCSYIKFNTTIISTCLIRLHQVYASHTYVRDMQRSYLEKQRMPFQVGPSYNFLQAEQTIPLKRSLNKHYLRMLKETTMIPRVYYSNPKDFLSKYCYDTFSLLGNRGAHIASRQRKQSNCYGQTIDKQFQFCY